MWPYASIGLFLLFLGLVAIEVASGRRLFPTGRAGVVTVAVPVFVLFFATAFVEVNRAAHTLRAAGAFDEAAGLRQVPTLFIFASFLLVWFMNRAREHEIADRTAGSASPVV
jgi:hypothetical protein